MKSEFSHRYTSEERSEVGYTHSASMQSLIQRLEKTSVGDKKRASKLGSTSSDSDVIFTDDSTRVMFVARVLTGRFCEGNSKYKRPPEIEGKSGVMYDSCVDKLSAPRIFVVFDMSQAYPEYIIEYKYSSDQK